MAARWKLTAVTLWMILAVPLTLHADIYRWDTGEVIPGTEGITPGPGVQLDNRQLEYAKLGGWNPGEAIDLTGAIFEESNLTNAQLNVSTLTNANLKGANLRNANLFDATGLTSATFSPESVYSQWTVFPERFDPAAAGLMMVMSPTGDLDANDTLDAADIDMLANKIGSREYQPPWLPDAAFDFNSDTVIDLEDRRVWVKDLAHTWYGDANLNGEFDSNDFVQVFQVGKYEMQEYAGWSEGEWNGDGLFDSNDFVIAFQDGGYEQGSRTNVAAVPEPGSWVLLLLGLAAVVRRSAAAVVN